MRTMLSTPEEFLDAGREIVQEVRATNKGSNLLIDRINLVLNRYSQRENQVAALVAVFTDTCPYCDDADRTCSCWDNR